MQRTRLKPQQSGILIQVVVLGIILIIAVALFILIYWGARDTVSWIFDTKPKPTETRTTEHVEEKTTPASIPATATKDVYIWTDEKGVKNFSNFPPPDHVAKFEKREMPVGDAMSGETKVIIRGNMVIVPVKLFCGGKEISTKLLLDTGAGTTLVNHKIGKRLNKKASSRGIVRVADGRSVPVHSVDLDYIMVGPHKFPNFRINVMELKGKPASFDGLLGMNFLRKTNYRIDFDRQVISWTR